MNIRLLGFPNHTAQAYVLAATTGQPGLEPDGMEAVYVKTDEPSDRARLALLDPFHSQIGFDTNLVPITIDGLAAVRHNVADGGQIRFVGWGGSSPGVLNPPTIAVPSTIVASTNRTGSASNVDELIAAPDGLTMGPSDTALAWSVTLRFTALSGTINTAADMMAIVVRVRRMFTGAGADDPRTLPVVTASLAAPVFALGRRAVTVSDAEGQIFIFPFQRSSFTSVSDLQVKLDFTTGASFSGAQYAVLESAACYYEQVTVGSPTHDSGWMTVSTDSRLARTAPTQHLHYFPETPWENITAYAVQFRTDQAIHDLPFTVTGLVPQGGVPEDPLTYIDVGVVPAGVAIAPSRGIRHGAGPMAGTPEVSSAGNSTTLGGQSYGSDVYGFRASGPVEIMVTRDELRLLQDQIGFRKGRTSPFYIALEPDVALEYQMFSAYWAVLKSISEPRPLGRYKTDGSMLFSVELSFQERL